MKNILKITTGLLATSLLAACSVSFNGTTEAEAGQYYSGYVYDGVSAQKVTGYTLTIKSNAQEALKAEVEKDGYYTVGPVKPGSDFVLDIKKDGYRDFTAIENGEWDVPGTNDGKYTDFVEAYLFPTDVESPAFTLNLYSDNVDLDRPTGRVRFFPTSGSALSLENRITTGSGDRWANDLDAHNKTVVLNAENGVLSVDAGALVYGVTYDVTVFAADGHAYRTFDFTAGVDSDQTIRLLEVARTGLELVSTNIQNGKPVKSGQLVITLNRPVELSPSFTTEYYREMLDSGFSINSPDANTNGDVNALPANASSDDQESGTSLKVDGNVVTLSWDGTLDTEDSEDPILSVNWSNLGSILLRVVGEENSEVALSTVLGVSNVTVQTVSTPL